MSPTLERSIRRLLHYSLCPAAYKRSSLTVTEQTLISATDYEELMLWLQAKHPDPLTLELIEDAENYWSWTNTHSVCPVCEQKLPNKGPYPDTCTNDKSR